MSQNRFSSDEGNMADFIAQTLPKMGRIEHLDAFHRDVLNWCMKNHDIVQLVSKIPYEDDEAFCECLELLRDRNDVEGFGMVLAMRLRGLQRY